MSMMQRVQSRLEAECLLKSRGLQPTSQRVEVLYQLHASGCHLAADDLHLRLNEEFSRVSRATVYNTLNLFKSCGLVGEVLVDGGRVLYDANVEPHFHIYNLDTGELLDVESTAIPLESLPPVPEGLVLQGVDIIIKVGRAGVRDASAGPPESDAGH